MIYNRKAAMWLGLIFGVLLFVYNIYLLKYLNKAEKCDAKMKTDDKQFRKTAVVITWIQIIASGATVLGLLVGLLSGTGYMPRSL